MISHEYECIFLHIPKCAGTSIEEALGHNEGKPSEGPGRDHWQDHRTLREIERPRLTPSAFSSRENLVELARPIVRSHKRLNNPRNAYTVTREQYERYYKFTVVRNPFARVVSWYRNVLRKEQRRGLYEEGQGPSFGEFLERDARTRYMKPQAFWLKNFAGEIRLDRICRFENLAADFASVVDALGIGPLELPHTMKTASVSYISFYDDQTIEHVTRIYAEDIALFGYSYGD